MAGKPKASTGKKKATPPEDLSLLKLDEAMDGVILQNAVDNGSNSLSADFDNRTLVIPLPGFCLEWMLGINGWPLSRSATLAAETHVGKTAFLTEIVRWHRMMAGRGAIACTEGDKDAPTMRHSILQYDHKAMEYRVCKYLEAWQDYLTHTAKRVMALFAREPRYTVPLCVGVDSVVGALCKAKSDAIWEKGHAKQDYATEAKLFGDWFKTYCNNALAGNPFTFIGTSHIRLEASKMAGLPDKIVVSGGSKLLYHTAITFLMKLVKKIDLSEKSGKIINFRLLKNTMAGTEHIRRFDVGMYWYSQEGRQVTWWDWDEATVWLLADRERFPARGPVGSKVVEVCNIHSGSGGKFWCKQLGVSESDAMSASELGKILHQNQEVLDKLRDVFSIYRHPHFKSFVEYRPVTLNKQEVELPDGEIVTTDAIEEVADDE